MNDLIEEVDRMMKKKGWSPVDFFGYSLRIYQKGNKRMLYDFRRNKEIMIYTINEE